MAKLPHTDRPSAHAKVYLYRRSFLLVSTDDRTVNNELTGGQRKMRVLPGTHITMRNSEEVVYEPMRVIQM